VFNEASRCIRCRLVAPHEKGPEVNCGGRGSLRTVLSVYSCKMPGNYCCVPLCDGRGGHKLPKDQNMRLRWLAAIRRDKWTPTDSTVVCRRHFRSSDYRTENTSGKH